MSCLCSMRESCSCNGPSESAYTGMLSAKITTLELEIQKHTQFVEQIKKLIALALINGPGVEVIFRALPGKEKE